MDRRVGDRVRSGASLQSFLVVELGAKEMLMTIESAGRRVSCATWLG